jgi:hypoxanthine phosphoribosyltransferase
MPKIVSGVMSDLERVMIRASVIQARVAEMADEINRDFSGKVITVVALMDGSVIFLADLVRAIELPVRVVTLNASSYHGGTVTTGEVRLPWPAGLSLKGDDVLLIDDILDTGLTLAAVQKRLADEGVATLRTGVLLKKRRELMKPVDVDYVGFEIEDEFVVGYGMDYNGRFRNLPCIGTLKLD